MATVGQKIAEVYFEVKTRTGKATEELKKLHEAAERDLKDSRERLAANKEFIKLREKNIELTKKQLAEVAKEIKADKNATSESIKNLANKVKEQEKASKKYEKGIKKNLAIQEKMDGQIRRVWTNFTEWTGQELTKRGAISEAKQNKALASYKSFLRRASREESRFANKLDQRDMTKSVIENARRGFAKGLLISEKWHKDENQLQRISRGLGIAGSSMDKIKSYAERAADGFYTLQRVGFTLQAGLSVIGSTLGSLVGGFLGLIGVVAQAGAAVVGVASAFLSVAAGAIAAKVALGGVGKAVSALWDDQNGYNRSLRDAKRALRDLRFEAEQAALSEEEAALALERAREELARVQDLPPDSRARREVELQYQQAELSYRRAKARNKDARADLKKGPLSGAAAQDPLKNLTKSQKEFAKYLVSLKPKLMELREAAASGFLKPLQEAIQNLVTNAFPTLKDGLNTLGAAMGAAAKSFSSAVTTPENLKLLREFFNSSVPIIKLFGQAAGYAFGGILAVLKAAQPLTLRFAKWVESVAARFEDWAKSGATSTLREFFNLAGDVAGKLGTVFSKVFGGITNITKAAFPSGPESGAGGLIIKWLDKLATTFRNFTAGPDFGTWLKGSTDNALTALDTLGKFANIFVKLGAAPETKQFWMTIQGAVPYIQKLAEDGLKAAPALGEIIVQIARMFAILSDSGTLETFLGALAQMVTLFNGFLEFISPVLKFFGPLHGLILAVGFGLNLLRKGGMVLFGVLEKVFRAFGNVQAGMVRVHAEAYTLGTRVSMLSGTYKKLKVDAIALSGPFAKLRAAINLTQRQAGTKRRMVMLEQMAAAAGATTTQIKTLRKELELAASRGASSLNQLTKGSATAKQFNLAGAGTRATSGRNALGRGASGALGAAGMLGSMAGGTGPASGFMGGAAMIASFLPGPLGLISSAVLGIGSAIVGGFEAAAQAEKQKKEELRVQKLEAQIAEAQITVEKETKFGEETLAYMREAGLNIKQAASAVAREQKEAGDLATKYMVATTYDEEGKLLQTGEQTVNSMRTALVDAGFGKDFAKNTKNSNLLLEAAVKLRETTNVRDPQVLAATVAEAFKTGGAAGLKNIIKEDAQLATDPLTGKQLVTTKAGATDLQTKKGNIDFATAAIDPLTEQVAGLKKALGTVANINDAGGSITTRNAKNTAWYKELTGANFDFTQVKGYNPQAKAGQYFAKEDLVAAVKSQLGGASDRLYNFQQQKTTGVAADYRGQMRTDNYTSMMMNQVVPKSTIAETTANTTAKAANTTANAATVMANAASTIANVANVAIKQPTWVIVNTGKPATNATASELLAQWVNTGVNPIPGKKP
jgi:hypothetical protein